MKKQKIEQLWQQLNGMVRQGEALAASTPLQSDRLLWSEGERAQIAKLSAPTSPVVATIEDYVARLFGENVVQSTNPVWTKAELTKMNDWSGIAVERQRRRDRRHRQKENKKNARLAATERSSHD